MHIVASEDFQRNAIFSVDMLEMRLRVPNSLSPSGERIGAGLGEFHVRSGLVFPQPAALNRLPHGVFPFCPVALVAPSLIVGICALCRKISPCHARAACSFPESRRRKTRGPHLPSGGCASFMLYYSRDCRPRRTPPTGGRRSTRCPARSATDESKYRPHPRLSALWNKCLIMSSHTVEKSLFFARRVTLGSSEIRFIVIIVRCGPVVDRRPRWRVRSGLSGCGRS
jgi:hypothetical protein